MNVFLCGFNHKLTRSMNSDKITHHSQRQKEIISGEKQISMVQSWFYHGFMLFYGLPLYRRCIILTHRKIAIFSQSIQSRVHRQHLEMIL